MPAQRPLFRRVIALIRVRVFALFVGCLAIAILLFIVLPIAGSGSATVLLALGALNLTFWLISGRLTVRDEEAEGLKACGHNAEGRLKR